MMRQLSPLDAGFLMVESATTSGHVGSLIVLEGTTADGRRLGLAEVRTLFTERLHLWPIFRQRLLPSPLGLTRPYWVDDPDLDLDDHFRELALPEPGSDQQLGEQVAQLHERPLDRQRPPWEISVITGLAAGRTAVYAKIHHAAIDGMTGAEMLSALLDISPTPRTVEADAAPFDPRPLPTKLSLVGKGVTARLRDRVKVVASAPPAVLHARAVVANRPRAPRSPLNSSISAQRRFAFGSLALDDIKRVRRAHGGTVNDVVMALCAAALRRWLLERDALSAAPLVAAVPVSVRARGRGGPSGNQLSLMLAELPTNVDASVPRVEAARIAMDEAKATFGAVPPDLLQDLSALLPTTGHGIAARALLGAAGLAPRPAFNLFVSNIPGPRVPLYLAGGRVRAIYPVSSISNFTGALNITVFSHDGQVHLGVVACRKAVPQVWDLVTYVEDALAELVSSC